MSLSRRALMRRTATTGAAAIGIGAGAHHAGYSPIRRAQAVLPAIGVVGVAAGLSYLAYKHTAGDGQEDLDDTLDLFLGDSRDYGGYSDGSILHQELYQGSLEMKSADERVMTSIQNNVTNSQNIALSKGKAAVIEAMNAGKSESEAQTAMQNAIDGYFSTIQRNIIAHWNSQLDQIKHQYEENKGHPDLSPVVKVGFYNFRYNNYDFYVYNKSGASEFVISHGESGTAQGQTIFESYSKTLLDGSTQNYYRAQISHEGTYDNGSGGTNTYDQVGWLALDTADLPDFSTTWSIDSASISDNYGKRIQFGVEDPSDSTVDSQMFDTHRYEQTWSEVLTIRDQVNADLSGFVTDVYSQWSAGDIPTEDLVDPITAATELGQDYDHTRMRSAQAAMLGIPTQDARSLNLEIHTDGDTSTDGTVVEADLYTNHVPTDGSGNEVGFQKGTVYEPSTWSEPLYIAYSATETDEDGVITDTDKSFVQLESPFEVVQALDADGNEVDSFKSLNTNNQTTDVSALRDEIDQLNETIALERERAEAEADEGGGAGWIANNPTKAALAGGAALLAVFGLGASS